MSPVSSMLPPPVHEPAMAANGWAASGLGNDAGTTGSLGMATGPSGCSARAVGTNTEMRRKAAKPRMMLGFIVTPLHAPCDIMPLVTFLGRVAPGSGSSQHRHQYNRHLILRRHEHIAHAAHGANGIR